jgi:putative nucleotide binding protein
VGESEFKLFELVPKEGAGLIAGDRVYIGKNTEERHEIQHVKKRVRYDDLTAAAQSELPFVLEEIVRSNEERFVEFFNKALPLTTKFHTLELLPGLGKKTMWTIIEERKKQPFTSFEDIKKRVPALHHPEKLIVERILKELSEPEQKYHIFVAK